MWWFGLLQGCMLVREACQPLLHQTACSTAGLWLVVGGFVGCVVSGYERLLKRTCQHRDNARSLIAEVAILTSQFADAWIASSVAASSLSHLPIFHLEQADMVSLGPACLACSLTTQQLRVATLMVSVRHWKRLASRELMPVIWARRGCANSFWAGSSSSIPPGERSVLGETQGNIVASSRPPHVD